MNKTKKKWPKVILCILGLILLAVILFFGVLTITEFKPKDTETLEVNGEASKKLSAGDSLSIMTWNVGYCGLDENADFFMDGGKNVQSANKDAVAENAHSISNYMKESGADIFFLQEVDRDSKRSYHTDELDLISGELDGYNHSFAYNYKTLYVPYPVPPIGKVSSGIATLSSYDVSDSSRVSLPCPFKYPVRLANLKRCIMINRVPIEGSDKELVLVNLHLEAYDSGEGKIAQTKMLKEILEAEAAKGNYVIAGGDFNQTFSNCDKSAFPIISDEMWTPGDIDVTEFNDSLEFLMDNNAPSCRSLDKPLAGADKDKASFQYYLLDGFIISSNLQVDSFGTQDLGFKNTDHNPVLMTVTLK